MKNLVYLDANILSPPLSFVETGIADFAEELANPSSLHAAGFQAKRVFDEVRDLFLQTINLNSNEYEVFFFSSLFEAYYFLCGSLQGAKAFVSSSCEMMLFDLLNELATISSISTIKKDQNGVDNCESIEIEKSQKAIVFLSAADRELCTINIMNSEFLRKQREMTTLCCVDLSNSIGRIYVDVQNVDCALCSFSSAGGPSGIVALAAKESVINSDIFDWSGWRESVIKMPFGGFDVIGGLVEFLRHYEEVIRLHQKCSILRDKLESEILANYDVEILCKNSARLPNSSCVLLKGIHRNVIMTSMDLNGICVGCGLGCRSGSVYCGTSMREIGISQDKILSSIFVGFPWNSTEDDLNKLLSALKGLLQT